jgi:hypothetical protein
MSSTDIAPQPPPSRQVTAKVRRAIHEMVWGGLSRAQAAEAAGLKDNSLYVAFRRPETRQAYLAECEVLRVSGRAKRLHRLEELAAQDENRNAAVMAIKVAEQLGDDPAATGRTGTPMVPGLIIQVVNNLPSKPTTTIDIKPMPEPELEPEPQPVSIPGWCLPDDDNMA